jgi:hypothetical protein
MLRERKIRHSIRIYAPAERVWPQITEVDIESFHHPAYLQALGIPKPLRAEILDPKVGGSRVAYFDNGKRFTQVITSWKYPEKYSFTFQADRGFRVAYALDLADGPFRMKSGAYTISSLADGVSLELESRYELRGAAGLFLNLPIWIGLSLFQRYLLRGIKANAERGNAEEDTLNRDRRAM